jgi:hypothetical protein
LDPPRDGDRGSREDGMIAEVIPLRRRTPDHGSGQREPTHSGLFDPPPDPEPPEEYSVWERPTAELVRRERPDDLVPSRTGGRRWGTAVLGRRVHAAAILAMLVATVILILVAASSHRTRQNPASAGLGGVEAGLGAPLGGAPPSAPRPEVRRSTPRSRRAPTHRSTEVTRSAAPRPPLRTHRHIHTSHRRIHISAGAYERPAYLDTDRREPAHSAIAQRSAHGDDRLTRVRLRALGAQRAKRSPTGNASSIRRASVSIVSAKLVTASSAPSSPHPAT